MTLVPMLIAALSCVSLSFTGVFFTLFASFWAKGNHHFARYHPWLWWCIWATLGLPLLKFVLLIDLEFRALSHGDSNSARNWQKRLERPRFISRLDLSLMNVSWFRKLHSLCCLLLDWIVLYCIVLYCVVLCCTVLNWFFRRVLQKPSMYWPVSH